MSTPPPSDPSPPRYPSPEEYARKFFTEAVRHREDAHLLHGATRYPAAITAAMKAAELASQAVLIREGTLGWWERLQQTHQPLQEIRSHPVLGDHFRALEQHNAALIVSLLAMEKLAPARPGAGLLTLEDQANPEYPFFSLQPPAAPGTPHRAHLVGPSEYFTEAESQDYYRSARELLLAYPSLYPGVQGWGHALPPGL